MEKTEMEELRVASRILPSQTHENKQELSVFICVQEREEKSTPFIIWFVPNHTMGSCELEDPWMPPSLRRSPNLQGPEKTTHSNRGQRRVSTNISKKAGFCFRSSEWRPLLLELKAATGLHSTPKKQPSRNSAAPASWSTTSLATSLPVLEEALGGGGS